MEHTTDVDGVWSRDGLDLVVVCSPDRFHLGALERAVAAGVHTMVEKPLACDLMELERLNDLLGAAGTTMLTTCHPRRFDPPFLWCAEHLGRFSDELGAVVAVRYDFSYHRPSKEGLHTGLLADHINHEVDLVNFLLGRVSARWVRLGDSQLRYSAAGMRDDGVAVHLEGTRLLSERRYPERFELRFETGAVELDLASGVATVRDDNSGAWRHEVCGATGYEQRFAGLAAHLVACAAGAEEPYLTHADLRYNTAVSAALTVRDDVVVTADGYLAS